MLPEYDTDSLIGITVETDSLPMIPIRITLPMTLLAVDTDSLPMIPICITLLMTLLAVDTDSLPMIPISPFLNEHQPF